MAEYLKREAVLDLITRRYENPEICTQEINSIPAADVAPVVHGRWFYHDDGVITCSECGNAESSDSYYCRYCGAKMDGEPCTPSK